MRLKLFYMTKKLTLNLLQKDICDNCMNNIIGGDSNPQCTCACAYENNGGSTICENSEANYILRKHSPSYPYGCSESSTLNEHQFFMGCD